MASRKGRAADDVFIFSALVLGFSGRHTLLDALYLNTGISCCEPRVAPRRSVVKIEDPISYDAGFHKEVSFNSRKALQRAVWQSSISTDLGLLIFVDALVSTPSRHV